MAKNGSPRGTWRWVDLLPPMVAALGTMYEKMSITTGVFMLLQVPAYAALLQDHWISSTIKMASFAGSVIGMLFMGWLGDVIGRFEALEVAELFVLIGTAGGSLLIWGNPRALLMVLGICRFLLGVGLGGTYPLSGVIARESGDTEAAGEEPGVTTAQSGSGSAVAMVRMCHVPGMFLPLLVAYATWSLVENGEVVYRVVIGASMVFIFLTLLLIRRRRKIMRALRLSELELQLGEEMRSPPYTKERPPIKRSKWLDTFKNITTKEWRLLCGTGVVWFLYDFSHYGVMQQEPEIVQRVLGPSTSVKAVLLQSVVINLAGIPAVLAGYKVIHRLGVKWLQWWGMIYITILPLFLALSMAFAPQWPALTLGIFIIYNYCLNWGAAIAVFCAPTLLFKRSVRSTLSGVCAGMGKIGAVVGIYALQALSNVYSPTAAILASAIAGGLAATLTFYFIPLVPKGPKQSLRCIAGTFLLGFPFFSKSTQRTSDRILGPDQHIVFDQLG